MFFDEPYEIKGLPGGYYEGQKLQFGSLNYFIGKNGSLKTQLLQTLKKHVPTPSIFFIYEPGKHSQLGAPNHPRPNSDLLHQISSMGHADLFCAEYLHKNWAERERWKNFLKDVTGGYDVEVGENGSGDGIPRMFVKDEVGNELQLNSKDAGGDNKREISDGLSQLIVLAAYIGSKNFPVVGIDEPETNLHPQAISAFINYTIANIRTHRNIFIATHSPMAIRIGKDYQYFFFNKKQKRINQISGADLFPLRILLNYDQMRSFFADRILIVEGHQDQLILNAICEMQSIGMVDKSIFCAMGATNKINSGFRMAQVVRLFRDMGKEVFVMLDNPGTKTKEISYHKLREELVQLIKGDNIFDLKREDILDYWCEHSHNGGGPKDQCAAEISEGILTGSQKINTSEDYYVYLSKFVGG